jgi:small subunit ribosomal protein S9
LSEQAYFYGTGKRKCAIAQVRVTPGNGAIIVNGKPFEEIFGVRRLQAYICEPLKVTNTLDGVSVVVKVTGGGFASQAGAIRHGISRALLRMDENLRSQLRGYGLLTRDARVKERQKYGLRRARKARQYRKR